MRKRLDVLLVERGLFSSREQAHRAVLAGLVYLDGRLLDKPGHQVAEDAALEVRGGTSPYVSRGGAKLAGALDAFGLSVAGLVCLDLGASTGGFTDCLLQRGAAKVYALDVGHGQLAWKLRQDPRVVAREGVNARCLKPGDLPEVPDLVTIDVSFISLALILPAVVAILASSTHPPVPSLSLERGWRQPKAVAGGECSTNNGDIIALIKPQFEAGRGQVGKHGVVRDPEVHAEVLQRVLDAAAGLGLGLRGLTHSPLRGPEGNIEFFAWWGRGEGKGVGREEIERVVAEAHEVMGGGKTRDS